MDKLNIDIYTLVVTIIIAVLGWIFALWLQRNNVKHQHKVEIRYDIYKQFVQIHKETQDVISKLRASTSSPFILMESSMISFQVKLKSEQECLFEGEQKWNKYVQDIYQLNSEFNNKYIAMLYIFEDWTAALSSLLSIKNTLLKEIVSLQKIIAEQLDILQMYSVNHGHDWRNWDRQEIKQMADNIRESTYNIGCYLGDFMVLIHNNLLSKYFGQKRPTRKTLDPKYKVLTKNGIVENVDFEIVEKMRVYKEQLISIAQENLKRYAPPNGHITEEYEKYLRSLINGICPDCNNPIDVIDMEKSIDGFCFHYTCGHGWKGVTIKESISIKELLKIKSARKGFGIIRKIIQGWKPSGDPKLKHGVDVYMDVNRGQNQYHQIIKDSQTKTILHEEHSPLTEHK